MARSNFTFSDRQNVLLSLGGLRPDEVKRIESRARRGQSLDSLFTAVRTFRETFKSLHDRKEPCPGEH